MAPLALALAGCFQQAGTALQEPISVPDQSVNNPVTSVPLPTDADTGTGGTDNTANSGTLNTPTFELLPDTNTDGGTGNTDTTNPPVALTIISATIPPIATETPASGSDSGQSQAAGTEGTPVEGQFITPSGPLGPVTQAPPIVATVDSGNGETAATPSGLITPTAFSPIDAAGSCTHTVAGGDTLYRIAVKYGISVAQLKQANPQITSDIIQPGDVFKIPNCDASGSTGGNTVAQPTSAPDVPATALPSGSQTYVVKRGDTLYTIGLKFGVSAKAIQDANSISNPDRISPGQELVIPAKSG